LKKPAHEPAFLWVNFDPGKIFKNLHSSQRKEIYAVIPDFAVMTALVTGIIFIRNREQQT
jgi:hypothetical protein